MPTQQEEVSPTDAEAVSIQDAALRLAEDNARAEPAITQIFRFPSDNEVRLIEVDTTVAPVREDEAIAPYYFAADVKSGLPYRSAIALIAPEDVDHAPLPPDWGGWGTAQVIWPRLQENR